ncbi:hypothetical protein Pla22_03650 [Rubripirellula amarantea]|uniref:Glycine zipper domain-containing protein n=1 Tax=Rubripirellula amarantea TaxID=2527999 RepID=A0A5C5WRD5_9BACT|nr:glycine zipper domain-containing protein [Rubripirellula amarantea]TWT52739.1 hypothetical protein Pla22_03650 [Rubripirellula amarantea]
MCRVFRVPVFGICLLAFSVSAQTATAQYSSPPPVNQTRGATLGGLAGAVAGGLIGDNNGEAGAGAAIGGVIGAVTGGILGNAADKEAAYNQQRQIYAQQQQQAVVAQSSVSLNDVVSMSRSGLSENVIINQIQSRGVIAEPQVSDIIAMHQQGVSERVISAMQTAAVGRTQVARASQYTPPQQIVIPAPVIVEERIVVPYYPPQRVYYHHHHHRPAHPRGGVHIRF